MDPLADKLLVTAALVSLVELQIVHGWVAMIIIAREFAVSALRTIAASDGKVIAASKWGKLKTVIQIVAIITALINLSLSHVNPVLNTLTTIFMYAAVIITIISGVDYFVKNKGSIRVDK